MQVVHFSYKERGVRLEEECTRARTRTKQRTGAHPEEVVKVICGRNEICDVFEVSFDGE